MEISFYMEDSAGNNLEPNPVCKWQFVAFVYAPAVFLGAFLLFQVQLLMGKFILPWFGGSPEVWTACMLFFQVFLVAGYAYAHFSAGFLSWRTQVIVHIILLIAALAALPVVPGPKYKPTGIGNPTQQITVLLSVCVGLPYLVLSATGPLLQNWFRGAQPKKTPYRLYAFSNAGSLIALVSYPFIFEPAFTRQGLVKIWSGGLGVFVILCTVCGVILWKRAGRNGQKQTYEQSSDTKTTAPGLGMWLLWLALPAGASVELLAVTNKICQDVAVIPFLWVVPLSLYLLSFIICFHSEKWYLRGVCLSLFILSVVGVILARKYEGDMTVKQILVIHCAMLFFCCMVCHGELFSLRPAAKHLTGYYLMIAVGGAAGGIFVGVISPMIFNTYSELYVGLLVCALFVLLADKSEALGRGMRRWVWVVLLIAVAVIGSIFQGKRSEKDQRAILNTRNFFGVLTIWEDSWDEPDKHKYLMQHGTTFHGLQFFDEKKRLRPTAYYDERSGVGLVMEYLKVEGDRRIGAIGLGVGTIANYGKDEDYFRFYEINPEVERLAKEYFSYLENCPSKVDVIIADARLSLESEEPQEFDVLVLDAFAGDAVPVHLLTKEAFEIYLKHLKPGGVIAVHISSMHLDLESVVWKQAEFFGLKNVWIESDENEEMGILAANWILLTNNQEFITSRRIKNSASPRRDDYKKMRLWTDEYVNLFEILE